MQNQNQEEYNEDEEYYEEVEYDQVNMKNIEEPEKKVQTFKVNKKGKQMTRV